MLLKTILNSIIKIKRVTSEQNAHLKKINFYNKTFQCVPESNDREEKNVY